jgi:PKD repeat protein
VAVLSGPERATVGQPVTYTSAGSSDNGQITEVAWYFGDGTGNTAGTEATHTFAAPGTFTVGMVVRDDEGKADMKALEVQVDPSGPSYAFQGFLAPVDNPPIVNTVKAGQAIPVKFSLGGSFGLDVLAAGYPEEQPIDCTSGSTLDEVETTVTAGESSLQYDPITDTYTYVWKTERAWAGSCRRLVVGLTDNSRHAAEFSLR